MKQRRHLNWPLCGFIVYLLGLFIAGLVYANAQYQSPSLRLTEISRLSQNLDQVTLSINGSGLDKNLRAYLTLDAANRRAVAGTLPIWGYTVDIEIISGRAYVLNMGRGITVFDLANPLEPKLIRSPKGIGMPQAWRSDADEDRIFLSSMSHRMAVYDPAGMKMVYRFETGGNSYSSVHRDQYLFVANSKAGLAIFDISNSEKPRLLSRMALPGLTADLVFLDNFLLTASKKGGLHLIDITDVTRPLLLQTIAAEKGYDRVTVVGDFIYASDKGLKLDVFSLSDLGHLSLQASIPLFGTVRDFLLDDSRLYIAENSFGVSMLDVSDAAHPRRVGYVGSPGGPGGLALYHEYLYVTNNKNGVQIIDTRRFVTRKLTTRIDTPGRAFDLELDGRWIYIADGDAGLQVIDRYDQKNPKLVANLPTISAVTAIAKSQNMLFLALKDHGLSVVDIRNPLAPKLVSRLRTMVTLSDLVIRGKNLFASSLEKKLLKIDISDPHHPQVAESIDLPGRAWKIALAGDDVFVAAEKAGLQIVRFAPDQPGRLIAGLSRPWPMGNFAETLGVAVHGGYAYLVQGEEGLQIVDISVPERPREVELVRLPGQSLDIKLAENFVVLSSRWGGYNFVDISQPEYPFYAANINHSGSSGGFAVEAGILYALGRSTGLGVIPLPFRNTSISGSADSTVTFKKPQYSGWYDLSISDGENLESATAILQVD